MPVRRTRSRLWLFFIFSPAVALPLVPVWLFVVVPRLSVNRDTPPESLRKSAEQIITSVYARLKGATDTRDLYALLEPGVDIYYLFGPETSHPQHKAGDYKVNIHQSRWHCLIYPARREVVNGTTFEIWVAHFSGQGRWYRALSEHRYYYAAVSPSRWSVRTIIARSDKVYQRYNAPLSATLEGGHDGVIRIELPISKVSIVKSSSEPQKHP